MKNDIAITDNDCYSAHGCFHVQRSTLQGSVEMNRFTFQGSPPSRCSTDIPEERKQFLCKLAIEFVRQEKPFGVRELYASAIVHLEHAKSRMMNDRDPVPDVEIGVSKRVCWWLLCPILLEIRQYAEQMYPKDPEKALIERHAVLEDLKNWCRDQLTTRFIPTGQKQYPPAQYHQ